MEYIFNPILHPICFANLLRTANSTWIGHAPFGMFLVDILRPNIIVELGSYYGTSYCAFCQAVDKLEIKAKCYAIDTWQGDSQSGFFGNEVLEDLKKHHDKLYGNFSRLIRSTFDEAIVHFKDKSIDLLHIDGFHTYEAVKNDFEQWLPKMTERGVILFHDINVKERDFGVWQFWEEVKSKYMNFEFIHSHGLGVLIVGERAPEAVIEFVKFANNNPTKIQNFFYQLGMRFEMTLNVQDLQKELKRINLDITDINNQLTAKAQELNKRQEDINNLTEFEKSLQSKSDDLLLKEKQLADKQTLFQSKTEETEVNLQLKQKEIETTLFDLQNEKAFIEEQRKMILIENQQIFAKRLGFQRILSGIEKKETDINNLAEKLDNHFDSFKTFYKGNTIKYVIGVVTYNNSSEQIQKLLKSIELSIESVRELDVKFDIYVIDNGHETLWESTKTNIGRFDSLGNIGFGKAMNHLMMNAFADAQTHCFLCLNPDGVLHYEALNELVKLNKINPHSLIEARQFPEEHLKEYDISTLDTLWASGACLLIPRDIYDKTKGFDPNFFMYLEDVDLSWRARSAGFSIKIAANALFGHSVLDRDYSEDSEKYFFLSGRYLAHKWKNKDFIEWTELELIRRGHYSSKSELPILPKLENKDHLDLNAADFNHHFHFSPVRW